MSILDIKETIDYLLESQAMVGEIRIYAGASLPRGWMFCDGSELVKEDYPDLYDVIGDIYGTASDEEHFLLPNLCGRVPVGKGASSEYGATEHTLGQAGGQETVLLTANQSGIKAHTHTIPNHVHAMGNYFSAGSGGSSSAYVMENKRQLMSRNTTNSGGGGATSSASSAAAEAHENMPPYLGINYIIYVGGFAPSALTINDAILDAESTTEYFKRLMDHGYAYKKYTDSTSMASGAIIEFSVEITTHGRPVLVIAACTWNATANAGWSSIYISRGDTVFQQATMVSTTASHNVPGSVVYLDTIPAGTYTYTCTLNAAGGAGTFSENNGGRSEAPVLIAVEL